jgi:hypothetical protein
LIDSRRAEYSSSTRHSLKRTIAHEIYTAIKGAGGRFLQQVDIDIGEHVPLEDRMWVEVDEKKAIEKIKQGLRENRRKSSDASQEHEANDKDMAPPQHQSFLGVRSASQMLQHPQSLSMSPHALIESKGPLAVDPRLLLFQHEQGQPQLNHQLMMMQHGSPVSVSISTAHTPTIPNTVTFQSLCNVVNEAASTTQHDSPDVSLYKRLRNFLHLHAIPDIDSSVSKPVNGNVEMKESNTCSLSDEEVSNFLLNSLRDLDQPTLTIEEVEAELANLTDNERASALSDVFGKLCELNDQHKDKRAKRDLGKDSLAFLVSQMKLELQMIPDKQKAALMNALTKAKAEEFNDARLVRFLRCDDMNAKRAARRFVNYWEGRLEIFGSERYVLPITLNEALAGDIDAIHALESGLLKLLPHRDISGRQILFLEPCRHTKIGFSSAGALRAVWYIIEVAASEKEQDVESGVVEIVWDKNSTVWDYDSQVYSRWTYFETYAWPIQITAFHVCLPPPFILRVINPIMMALTDKRARARTIVHDVPENTIINALSSYGILKHMLPTVMGGDLIFDQSQWILDRRITEMEEI